MGAGLNTLGAQQAVSVPVYGVGKYHLGTGITLFVPFDTVSGLTLAADFRVSVTKLYRCRQGIGSNDSPYRAEVPAKGPLFKD